MSRKGSDGGAAPARHFILVSVDSLRFDALSGEPEARGLARHGRGLPARRRTPAFDRLAAAGVHFSAAYTSAPYTTNAHAGLFTGLWPWVHGVRTLWTRAALPADRPTLAESLKRNGFATLCASGMPHLFHSGGFGLERGFDDRIDLSTHLLNRGFTDMLSWMERHRDGRFFVFFHSTTVHDYLTARRWEKHKAGVADPDAFYRDLRRPCRAPMGRRMAAYQDAVNFFDERELAPLEEFLRRTGLADSTLTAVAGDHGEPHPRGLTEEEIRVPLVFRGPGVPAGRRETRPVRLMDARPTALELLGLPAGEGDAASLAPLWDGADAPDREVYSEIFEPARGGAAEKAGARALRVGGRKVVHDARRGWRAWDTERDPAERRPRPAVGAFAPLKRRLEEIRRADAPPRRRAAAEPSADVVRRLRQLGYLD